ncbi:MAG: hypothetical protein EP349_01330 [Alphaproteobacteria bacterium]|nr:MAG: hypothetical protein EP349_01330 [Alphaproteobacteria bacterium]
MYGYNDHESKSGKFLRSTGGGLSYYATLAAIPLATIFGLAHNVAPDLNETTNTDSQTALAEYINEGNSLTSLLEDAQTLRDAALNQTSAEAVLEMNDEAKTREAQLQTLGEAFSNRVLADNRLTESDYSALQESITIDETDYVDMPWLSNALDEARASATGTDAAQNTAAIRAYMDEAGDTAEGRILLLMLTFFATIFGAAVFGASGMAEDLRSGLSYKLDDMAQKRRKPKH